MALQITTHKRKFTFKKDSDDVTLSDPNKNLTPMEVMNFYASQYPELTTATVHGPVIVDDKAVYSFKTTVGDKG